MKTVLSTKKLSKSQRSLLLNTGIGLVEQDFIEIEPIPFEIEAEKLPENIIFTSQNAVLAIEKNQIFQFLKSKKIYCVGEKTAALLSEKGLKVQHFEHYGVDLAGKLVKTNENEGFLFFCGKKRRHELPEIFRKHKIPLTEVEVYDTIETPKKISRNFDGILFFSPSAVKSFCTENELKNTTAFCIGTTTASEANKRTEQIEIASKPTIESVIVQVVKYFK
ncbi:MAG TPA: uroporphyrinogen-III synthase [Salinimicrobium sp.]|nr:uroporphyrinogen-III synthase [Salinimicrobium sp.]